MAKHMMTADPLTYRTSRLGQAYFLDNPSSLYHIIYIYVICITKYNKYPPVAYYGGEMLFLYFFGITYHMSTTMNMYVYIYYTMHVPRNFKIV